MLSSHNYGNFYSLVDTRLGQKSWAKYMTNSNQGNFVTKLRRVILAAAVAATATQTCYGQWGVAAGAGAEQWNRMRELDIQEQQIDQQRQMQQLEVERFKREEKEYLRRQAQAEEARRRYDEEQRQQQARREAAKSRKTRDDAIISEFEKANGPDGVKAAEAIRGQIFGASLFKEYPDISEQQLRAALEDKMQSIRNIREAREKIAKFTASKKEYKNDENVALFNEELNNTLDMIEAGKIRQPGSFEKVLAITHERVKTRLLASKGGKKTGKEI